MAQNGGFKATEAGAPSGSKDTKTIAVLGAGSWGTALAVHLGRIGHQVRLWGRDAALVDELIARRTNPTYLPDVVLPSTVSPTAALDRALDEAAYVVVAVPSHGLRALARLIAPLAPPEAVI